MQTHLAVAIRKSRRAAVLAREAAPREGAASPAAANPAGAVAPAPSHAPEQLSAPVALELALFHMADELDLPPRRVRSPLVRLLKRLRGAHFTLDSAQKQTEAWMASAL